MVLIDFDAESILKEIGSVQNDSQSVTQYVTIESIENIPINSLIVREISGSKIRWYKLTNEESNYAIADPTAFLQACLNSFGK